ncbi:MAG TPA: lipase maturation factor family protein [Candidatus Polarisedimenticolia bacterium]|nr:lipase maturation factor family protein [Candidatus Polarisedimenticolia bacterium]
MISARSFWLTRFVVLRLLGFVYFFAFLSAALQIVPLVGADGLLPARAYLDRVAQALGSPVAGFLRLPSLFWMNVSDGALLAAAWIGVALSLLVLLGYANAILMAVLWALYFSFVSIGQDWYGYGWEIQLLETGAIAVFLCPLVDGRPFPRTPPPRAAILLLRWLAFRIYLGAGLIKMRGDACWRDLTCLVHHYETQPIPNPLSRFYHFRPLWFHKAGALYNHLAELVCPWLIWAPRIARLAAGCLMVVFQGILISSGNLSFLNYLTIVPCLAAFDDAFLRRLLPRALVRRAEAAAAAAEAADVVEPAAGPAEVVTTAEPARGSWWPRRAGERVAWGYALVVGALSVPTVLNLVSSTQIMNTSFDRLHLVNTYGAFGSVGAVRREIVFEGTDDAAVTAATTWKEYDFWCKPGTPSRRPCVIAPFQPRLDWQIWFAAMSRPERYPWTLHLVAKLLKNDPGALSLLSTNPFPDRPPRFVRAAYYRYEFAPPGNTDGLWWSRQYLGEWLPPLAADDSRLKEFLQVYGW